MFSWIRALFSRPLPIALPVPNSDSLKRFKAAHSFLGLREVDGPQSNPTIQRMISFSASWLDKDDSKTAWCGCAVAFIHHNLGFAIPREAYRAKNWATYGAPVKLNDPWSWQPGDIIVMKRTGGFHVTLFKSAVFDKENPNKPPEFFFARGGNQSNAFNDSRYKISDIIAVRR